MLTPGVGQDLGSMVERFGADAARAMYLASLRAVEYVGELTDREGIDAGLRMTGQLVVAQGRSGRRRLARQAELMERLGLPCERLDGGRLRERLRVAADVPGTGDEGPAALRLPTAGVLHPGRLLVGLAEAVTRRGGRIFEGAQVVAVSRGRRPGSAWPIAGKWWPGMWWWRRADTPRRSTCSTGASSPCTSGCS